MGTLKNFVDMPISQMHVPKVVFVRIGEQPIHFLWINGEEGGYIIVQERVSWTIIWPPSSPISSEKNMAHWQVMSVRVANGPFLKKWPKSRSC